MSKASPTQLSLRYLRKSGYTCSIAEHWSEHARRRIDLFGFVDLVAAGHSELLFIQVTSRSNVSSRVAKIMADPCLSRAIELARVPGVSILVHGWDKRDPVRPAIIRDLTQRLLDTR